MGLIGKHLTCWKGKLLFLSRAEGKITDQSFRQEMAAMHEMEESTYAPVHRVFDGRSITSSTITPKFMVARAINRRRMHRHRAGFKTALIGTHPALIDFYEVYSLIYEGSHLEIQHFACVKCAADWLEIPEDFLENRLSEL